MPTDLDGIVITRMYFDNNPGTFDTDQDGSGTQEDEFLTFTNTSSSPVDITGWEIWALNPSNPEAGGADTAADGLVYTFPTATLEPGDEAALVGEYSTTLLTNVHQIFEISSVESDGGDDSDGVTNFFSEGQNGGAEGIALVNPATGDFIVYNISNSDIDDDFQALPGFTGTNLVDQIDLNSLNADPDNGVMFEYDAATDSYVNSPVAFLTCFAAGTQIRGPKGNRMIEALKVGDLVSTGPDDDSHAKIIWIGRSKLSAADLQRNEKFRPVRIMAGALGNGLPTQDLLVSRQHRMLVSSKIVERMFGVSSVLVPAIKLINLPGVFIDETVDEIEYFHIMCAQHEIVFANDAPSESFLPGPLALRSMSPEAIEEIEALFPETAKSDFHITPAAQIPQAKRAHKLIARHVQNAKPIFQPEA